MSLHPESELVVIDNVEPCPYLPDQSARMPLRVLLQTVTPAVTDQYLERGYRRSGEFVYRTQCPACEACEPIRLEAGEFRFTRSFRRTLARGKRRYREVRGPLVSSLERVELFNRHRAERGLCGRDEAIDLEDYQWGFVRSCFDSFELAWYDQERLVGLSVVDRGRQAWSAVYTFYDPALRGDSLGTFAVLRQLELCLAEGIRWLYLGYYVEQCAHMNYKTRFLPHDRMIAGKWFRFSEG